MKSICGFENSTELIYLDRQRLGLMLIVARRKT